MTIGVYKVVHKEQPNKFYIGSSKNVEVRLAKHKWLCQSPTPPARLLYKELLADGVEQYTMEILETMDCYDSRRLKEREQHYITTLRPCLNVIAAYLTEDEKREYRRQLSVKRNKTMILCECGEKVRKQHRARHKKCRRHIEKMIPIRLAEVSQLVTQLVGT